MFAQLNCRSYYSFLRGAGAPGELARRAAELGIGALGLADQNGVYGAVEFYLACREAGVKAVLGAELTEEGLSGERSAVFLARNRKGWAGVCRLVTARQLDADFSLPRAAEEAGEGGDIFVLTPFPELIPDPAPETVYLSVGPETGPRRRRELARAAGERKLRTAAAGAVLFPDRADYLLFRLLSAIRIRTPLPVSPPPSPRWGWLKGEREEAADLDDFPGAAEAAGEIAADCRFEPELDRLRLPRYPLPAGEKAGGRLRALCLKGVRRRYREIPAGLRARLEKELSTIEELGMADYFLLVEEIAAFARQRGIPSLGRGSAAASLVCYLLSITGVDPLKHHLYFERFLNRARTDPPDIDLDFPTKRRGEVVEWIRRRFGSDRTATLSTTIRFRARSALGEAARALGMGEPAVRRLTRQLPGFCSLADPGRIRREYPESQNLPWGEKWFQDLLAIAGKLEGIPRHLSVHPGGVVIGPGPLTDCLALERARGGAVVTQPDMYSVKRLGLLKIDILGQRSLAVVEDAVRAIRASGVRIDLDRLDPEEDRRTGDLLAEGKTVGCFYIESPVMRSLLKRLRCRDFATLVAASSVIRPGVSSTGCADRFIARKRGREKAEPIHPLVDPILSGTEGVMIYQEQVMRVVVEAAGMSPAEADTFRRCMTKKPGWEGLGSSRSRFLEGAAGNRIPASAAEELWRQIEGFAAYAFCQAHSAAFARLSVVTAYLKAHYPAQFLAAVIANRGGFYPTGEYVQEARRLGLEILPPDVLRGGAACRAEGEGIRLGLREVKHLRGETIRRIREERERRPFSSGEDFLRRVRPGRHEVLALARAGALNSLGLGPAAAAWRLAGGGDPAEPSPLFPGFIEEPGAPFPAGLERSEERRAAETAGMGFSSLSPEADERAERLRRSLPGCRLIRSDGLAARAGEEVELIGSPVTGRTTRTRRGGKLMKFLTLEDGAGLFEAVLFPECYRRRGHLLAFSGPYHIRGTVRVEDGAAVVVCRDIVLTEGWIFANVRK
ncbi:MAG: DNA polymerase III subunit alpha [Candidatus Erginobacter occultus]|nr:DNA polymerase III subunit alpha [Candidatus Erginobacter occultus]